MNMGIAENIICIHQNLLSVKKVTPAKIHIHIKITKKQPKNFEISVHILKNHNSQRTRHFRRFRGRDFYEHGYRRKCIVETDANNN
jgi:hypothetical protein